MKSPAGRAPASYIRQFKGHAAGGSEQKLKWGRLRRAGHCRAPRPRRHRGPDHPARRRRHCCPAPRGRVHPRQPQAVRRRRHARPDRPGRAPGRQRGRAPPPGGDRHGPGGFRGRVGAGPVRRREGRRGGMARARASTSTSNRPRQGFPAKSPLRTVAPRNT